MPHRALGDASFEGNGGPTKIRTVGQQFGWTGLEAELLNAGGIHDSLRCTAKEREILLCRQQLPCGFWQLGAPQVKMKSCPRNQNLSTSQMLRTRCKPSGFCFWNSCQHLVNVLRAPMRREMIVAGRCNHAAALHAGSSQAQISAVTSASGRPSRAVPPE